MVNTMLSKNYTVISRGRSLNVLFKQGQCACTTVCCSHSHGCNAWHGLWTLWTSSIYRQMSTSSQSWGNDCMRSIMQMMLTSFRFGGRFTPTGENLLVGSRHHRGAWTSEEIMLKINQQPTPSTHSIIDSSQKVSTSLEVLQSTCKCLYCVSSRKVEE